MRKSEHPWKRGRLVVVEGIDGAGKTTVVANVADFLARESGMTVACDSEPTGGPHGVRLRESFRNERMPIGDELDELIADRMEHVDEFIIPALVAGKVVLLDRYWMSTCAYQGPSGISIDWIREVHTFAPRPDVTLLIDADPVIALGRVNERSGKRTSFERMEVLRKARKVYLDLARGRTDVKVLDGNVRRDGLITAAKEALTDAMGRWV